MVSMASVNIDPASRLDVTCRRGDTFTLNTNVQDLSGNPLNTTLYTFKTEVRTYPGSSTVVIASSSFTYETSALGVFMVKATAATMAAVAAGTYAYDVQATDNTTGVVCTWMYGTFTVNQDITQ